MISSRCGLNSANVMTTALSERVADAIALVVISALVLLTLQEQPGWLAETLPPQAFHRKVAAGYLAKTVYAQSQAVALAVAQVDSRRLLKAYPSVANNNHFRL